MYQQIPKEMNSFDTRATIYRNKAAKDYCALKTVLVEKINTFLESENYVSRIGTTVIGRTESDIAKENVFVLSNEVLFILR